MYRRLHISFGWADGSTNNYESLGLQERGVLAYELILNTSMPSFLQIELKLLSPLRPRWIEEQIFNLLLVVPVGCGNLLFVTGDHFLHQTAGCGRGVGSMALEEAAESGLDLGPLHRSDSWLTHWIVIVNHISQKNNRHLISKGNVPSSATLSRPCPALTPLPSLGP